MLNRLCLNGHCFRVTCFPPLKIMMKYRFIVKDTRERVHARANSLEDGIERAMRTLDYWYRESERTAPQYWDLQLVSTEKI